MGIYELDGHVLRICQTEMDTPSARRSSRSPRDLGWYSRRGNDGRSNCECRSRGHAEPSAAADRGLARRAAEPPHDARLMHRHLPRPTPVRRVPSAARAAEAIRTPARAR
jgi:hypothetical protein